MPRTSHGRELPDHPGPRTVRPISIEHPRPARSGSPASKTLARHAAPCYLPAHAPPSIHRRCAPRGLAGFAALVRLGGLVDLLALLAHTGLAIRACRDPRRRPPVRAEGERRPQEALGS